MAFSSILTKVLARMEDLYSIRNDDKRSLQSKQPRYCWPSFVSVVPHRCIREFTFIISVQVVIQTIWSSIPNSLLMLLQCPPSSDWYLDSWGRTSHCLSHFIFIFEIRPFAIDLSTACFPSFPNVFSGEYSTSSRSSTLAGKNRKRLVMVMRSQLVSLRP